MISVQVFGGSLRGIGISGQGIQLHQLVDVDVRLDVTEDIFNAQRGLGIQRVLIALKMRDAQNSAQQKNKKCRSEQDASFQSFFLFILHRLYLNGADPIKIHYKNTMLFLKIQAKQQRNLSEYTVSVIFEKTR